MNDLNHSPISIAPDNRIITMLTFTSRLSDRAAIAPASMPIDAASIRVWLLVIFALLKSLNYAVGQFKH